MLRSLFLVVILVFIVSCKTKFDKKKWLIKNGDEYVYRDKMLTDLLNKNKLEGATFEHIIELLGNPDDECNFNTYELGYRIKEVHELDSLKIKSLVLTLSTLKEEINLSTKIIKVQLLYW